MYDTTPARNMSLLNNACPPLMMCAFAMLCTGQALQLGPSTIVKITTVADKWDCSMQRTRCMDLLNTSLDNLE